MKLGRTVNLGGFQSIKFESSEHANLQECARDLLAQMTPMAGIHTILNGVIAEIRKAYNV